VLYHTDSPVLVGAPVRAHCNVWLAVKSGLPVIGLLTTGWDRLCPPQTGSGKTIIAELALLRMKTKDPRSICVYIAPLKALARERLKEWQLRFGSSLHWSVLELSGDTRHDQGALQKADVLVCTPEKWDLITRGWRGAGASSTDEGYARGRSYLFRVKLVVIDEIHLLGEERGAVLEAIVSRTRFISMYAEQQQQQQQRSDCSIDPSQTRIIGLSTALANPVDLADWIGIDTTSSGPTAMRGLYNFRPSVRPVPTKVCDQSLHAMMPFSLLSTYPMIIIGARPRLPWKTLLSTNGYYEQALLRGD
jgi:superfamily II helicase